MEGVADEGCERVRRRGVTDVSRESPKKAQFPMDWRLAERRTEVRPPIERKASPPIVVTVSGSETETMVDFSLKALPPMAVMA